MIIAKTSPRLSLREHTQHVLEEAKSILSSLPYGSKYERLTGQNLSDLLLMAARYHDVGKGHPRWQAHARQGSLLEVGLRHELASLLYLEYSGRQVEAPVRAAIAAHHNKLSHRHRHRWTQDAYNWGHLNRPPATFQKLWDDFSDLETNTYLSSDFAEMVRTRYAFDTVRGLLQLADRRASQAESPGSPEPLPLETYAYEFPYTHEDGTPAYRPVQEAVATHADRMLLALRSETGSGKTAASLLWASRQVEAGRACRAIIALPTRFTSSALASDVSGSVRTGLYHSSAWQQLQGEARAFEKLQMARQFLYPLTVTTIDQVLACLTGRREEHHLRFANLAHSCLIIDECDFYDDFVQANIQCLMQVLEVLEVPVLVMSATLPTRHLHVYAPTLKDAPASGEDLLLDTTRTGARIRIASITAHEAGTALPEAVRAVLEEEPRVIVYANTVASAMALFDAVRSLRPDVIVYHSRFTEPHKAIKEKHVRAMLGREGTGGVVIMTQIGEMSLNISAPMQISEACPIDRLAERTGRMGRFSGQDGTLHLLLPQRKGQLYPAPYGTLSDKYRWIPSPALTETIDVLQEGQWLTKADLADLTNEVYNQPVAFSPEAKKNARQLEKDIRVQWLIVPAAQMELDDTEAAMWQSRMIGPQTEVFVTPEPLRKQFDSRRAFEIERSRHAISVPLYRLRSERDRFARMDVQIEDEQHAVLVLSDPSDYTLERGLMF